MEHTFYQAIRYGGRNYINLDQILRNWKDEGTSTLEEILDRELSEQI